jgi:hypothetical protein
LPWAEVANRLRVSLNKIESILLSLERRVGRVGAAILVTLVIALISYFLASSVDTVNALTGHRARDYSGTRFVNSYMPLSYDPFHTRFTNPDWQMTRQRILGPLIAHWLHLQGRPSELVLLLANLLIYFTVYLSLRRRTQPCTAFAAATVLSLTLTCIISQVLPGYQDSLAALFLIFAMLVESPALSAGFVFVGMFADERVLSAGILLVLWHLLLNPQTARRQIWVRSAWLAGAAAAWAVYYLLLRHYMGINLADVRRVALGDIKSYRTNFWIGWYYGLRGGWILPIAFMLIWLRDRPRWPALLMAGGILPVFAASIVVLDISRIASYAFPALIIATVFLYRRDALLTNHLLIASLIMQIFTPIWTVVAGEHQPIVPVPYVILQHFSPPPVRVHSIPATQP